jgi:RNA-splicing ligase RtcB
VFGQTGQPLLVPGTNRTSSYLCIPGEHADRAMYTACHGAGTVVGDFARSGASTLDPHARTTRRFDCRSGDAETVRHLDDHAVDTVVGVLRDHCIAQPVVRLRPFAVQN